MPSLMSQFQNEKGKLKTQVVNIVDNGLGEQLSSPLVQMLLVRLCKFLRLDSACQVSYSEYHSKRNFVERVHAQENKALSRHGPFSSKLVHATSQPGNKEYHQENMEAMVKEFIHCISTANFGGMSIAAERGITDEELLFEDEAVLKNFLSLSEARKETFNTMYKVKPGKLLNDSMYRLGPAPKF